MEVVRPQLVNRWISVSILVFCLFFVTAHCFYLPGVAPQDFMKVVINWSSLFLCSKLILVSDLV